MPRSAGLIGLGLAALVARPASGQDPGPPQATKGSIDIGFVNAAGNTNVTTLNIGQRLSHVVGDWKVAQGFALVYGRTDGTTSASSWKANLRSDRRLSPRLATFLLAGFEKDRFAGIDRRFEEALGMALRALQSERDLLEIEAGVALIQQRSSSGLDDQFAAGRVAARYRRTLHAQAYAEQAIEALPNLENGRDVRINSETTLVAPLSARLALKASYVVRYDRQPEPGFRTTDRLLTTGLQIVF